MNLENSKGYSNKKGFLSQYKEIEGNNRMGGKKRSLQENWRFQGNISCKDSTIKDGNSKDLIDEEEIKKRWQEYTEDLYKKHLNDQDNHDSVVTHLEPDTLECEVKWG